MKIQLREVYSFVILSETKDLGWGYWFSLRPKFNLGRRGNKKGYLLEEGNLLILNIEL